jgi:transglutaminase-like putative cysteine protease
VARRLLSFTDEEKANKMDTGASEDASDPVVRQLAAAVAGSGSSPEESARRILRYAQRRIAYAGDTNRTPEATARFGREPGVEELADTLTICRRGFDDCDGKARVCVAFLRARGIEARIRPVRQQGAFVHVQAEARWPGSERHPLTQPDGWILLEPTAREALLGEGPQDVIDRTGQLLVHER